MIKGLFAMPIYCNSRECRYNDKLGKCGLNDDVELRHVSGAGISNLVCLDAEPWHKENIAAIMKVNKSRCHREKNKFKSDRTGILLK